MNIVLQSLCSKIAKMRKLEHLSSGYYQKRLFLVILAVVLALTPLLKASAQEETDDPDPISIFNEAQDHHEKGELQEAIRLYKKAIELYPEFPEAEMQMGSAYLSLRDRDEAEAAFRRAIELRDDWTLAMSALGSLLVQKGNFEEAETLLTRSLELEPLNFPAWAGLTDLRLRTGASEDVLKKLLADVSVLTTKAKPTSSIWASRGALEHRLGDLRAASASVNKALAIDRNNEVAIALAADIALNANDPEMADTFIQRLRSIEGDSNAVKMLKARSLILKNDAEQAISVLTGISPQTPASEELIAKLKAATNDDPAELEKELDPAAPDPLIVGRLCSLYRRTDPMKALEYCRKAAELEPQNIAHAIGFGSALIQAKRYPEAAGLFKRLVEFAPDNSTARANLASALFYSKQYEEAKKEFRWMLDRQPDLTAAYYFLAVCHDHLKEYMDAMANYQEFLRRADAEKNKEDIDRITLRLPSLQRQIRQKGGRKR